MLPVGRSSSCAMKVCHSILLPTLLLSFHAHTANIEVGKRRFGGYGKCRSRDYMRGRSDHGYVTKTSSTTRLQHGMAFCEGEPRVRARNHLTSDDDDNTLRWGKRDEYFLRSLLGVLQYIQFILFNLSASLIPFHRHMPPCNF